MKLVTGLICMEVLKYFSFFGIIVALYSDNFSSFLAWVVITLLGIVAKEIIIHRNG